MYAFSFSVFLLFLIVLLLHYRFKNPWPQLRSSDKKLIYHFCHFLSPPFRPVNKRDKEVTKNLTLVVIGILARILSSPNFPPSFQRIFKLSVSTITKPRYWKKSWEYEHEKIIFLFSSNKITIPRKNAATLYPRSKSRLIIHSRCLEKYQWVLTSN